MRIAIVSDYGTVNGGAAKVAADRGPGAGRTGPRGSFRLCDRAASRRRSSTRASTLHHLGQADVWTERNPLRAAARGIWNRAPARRASRPARELRPARHDRPLPPVDQGAQPERDRRRRARRLCRAPSRCTTISCSARTASISITRAAAPAGAGRCRSACLAAACDSHSRAHKAVRVIRQVESNAALRRIAPPLNLIHVSASAREVAQPALSRRHAPFRGPEPEHDAEAGCRSTVRANRAFVYIGRFTPEKGPAGVRPRGARRQGARGLPRRRPRGGAPAGRRTRTPSSSPGARTRRSRQCSTAPARWSSPRSGTRPRASSCSRRLSKGVPVICSRGTGAADWIEDGVERLSWSSLATLAGLQARLRQLADDDDLAARLGDRAYLRYWREPPTIEAHTERLERVYDVILSGRGADSAALSVAVARPVPAREHAGDR